jgi:hypothetical protein
MSVSIKISTSLLLSLNLLEYQCTSCRTKRLYNLWMAGSGSHPNFSNGNDSFRNNSEYLSGSEACAAWPAKLKIYKITQSCKNVIFISVYPPNHIEWLVLTGYCSNTLTSTPHKKGLKHNSLLWSFEAIGKFLVCCNKNLEKWAYC